MDHSSFTVGRDMTFLNLVLQYLRGLKTASYAETFV